jgi:hypothetical protein
MMGNDADFRIRNFKHMLSILFPVNTPKHKIIKQYNQIYGILREGLNATIADDNDAVSFVREILNPSLGVYLKESDPITTIKSQQTCCTAD